MTGDNDTDELLRQARHKTDCFEAFLAGYRHRLENPTPRVDYDEFDEFRDEIHDAFETWYEDE